MPGSALLCLINTALVFLASTRVLIKFDKGLYLCNLVYYGNILFTFSLKFDNIQEFPRVASLTSCGFWHDVKEATRSSRLELTVRLIIIERRSRATFSAYTLFISLSFYVLLWARYSFYYVKIQ